MKLSVTAAGLFSLALTGPSLAFIGHGIQMYYPLCAYACRAAIASAPLSCSDHSHSGGAHMGHGGGSMTTPACRASDDPFLTTLGWCIHSKCAEFDVEVWELEKYWLEKTTGDASVTPKWTYTDTLAEIRSPPERELGKDETLNFTARVPENSWMSQKMTLKYFEEQETLHAKYGMVLLVVGFGTPILFTLLGYLPYMTGILQKIKPYLVYPSIIGTYHTRPLPYFLGNAPTVGHSLYITMFLILNIVLTAIDYRSTQPNTWFASTYQEIMAYVSCRTGVLAFALAPLVILFSGRNNILLWLTNWSHSTYLILHRWVARIFAVHVILHSVVELALYIDKGEFKTETKLPYWIWGIVATLTTSIMLVASMLYVRRWSYEVFLITHIVLALLTLVGSWYHVELLFTRKWGYEFWLYAVFAVWGLDRVLRVFRILKNGVRPSTVTEITGDIVRVDVGGVRWASQPGVHTYAYFPTLNPWKPWENHPFSVIPTAMLRPSETSTIASPPQECDIEKNGDLKTTSEVRARSAATATTTGVSLYIRKATGITKFLQAHHKLTTLLDGPYPNNSSHAVLKCDRVVLVGGGIGITSLLPYLACHVNIKLYWSVKQNAEGLVRDLERVLESVEKDVRVGRRLQVEELLKEEAEGGWGTVGVVVCGPPGLCDDVRAGVVRNGKNGGTVWELQVDAFSW